MHDLGRDEGGGTGGAPRNLGNGRADAEGRQLLRRAPQAVLDVVLQLPQLSHKDPPQHRTFVARSVPNVCAGAFQELVFALANEGVQETLLGYDARCVVPSLMVLRPQELLAISRFVVVQVTADQDEQPVANREAPLDAHEGIDRITT